MMMESLVWALVGFFHTLANLSAAWRGFQDSLNPISVFIYIALGIILVLSFLLLLKGRRRRLELQAVADHVFSKERPLSKEELDEICERLPPGLFREQMKEYIEALVPLAGQYYNTHQTDSFLRDSAVMQDIGFWKSIRYPLLKVVPGVFTGLGILGTFLGIAIGLGILGEASRDQIQASRKKVNVASQPSANASPGAGASSKGPSAGKALSNQKQQNAIGAPKSLSGQVPAVISQLSVAFWTSIVAVVFAIFIGFLGNTGEASLLRTVTALREAIDRRVVRLTPDKMLQQVTAQLEAGTSFAKATSVSVSEGSLLLKSLNKYALEQESLISQGNSALTQVANGTRETKAELSLIRAGIADIQSLLSEEALEEWKRQTGTLRQIREETEESRVMMQTFANDLAEKLGEKFGTAISTHLGPHLESMAESVSVQMKAATESSSEHARRFADEAVQQMTGALQQSIQHMGAEVKSASEQIGSASAHMHEVVNNATDSMAQQRDALALNDRTVAAAQDQSREAAKNLAAMQSVIGELAGMIKDVQSGQARAAKLHDAQRDLQQQSAEGVAGLVSSAQSVSDAYAQAAQQLLQTLGKLEEHFETIDDSVGELTEETKTAVEGIREASDKIFGRITAEEKLVTQYGDTARQFSEAFREGAPLIERLALVSEAAKQALGHLRDGQHELSAMQVEQRDIQAQSVQQVSGVVDGIGTATEAYARTAANLGQIIEKLEGLLGGLSGSLGKLSNETTVAGTTIREAADKINERVTDEERLLEGYGNASRSFERAFTSSQSALDRVSRMAAVVTEAMQKADDDRRGVNDLRRELVAAGKTLQEAAQEFSLDVTSSQESFQTASERVSSSVENSSHKLSEVLSGSEEWALAVNGALAQFSSRMESTMLESLSKIDDTLGTAVRTFASTIQELEDVVDDLRSHVGSQRT